jgi:hypothetical protein
MKVWGIQNNSAITDYPSQSMLPTILVFDDFLDFPQERFEIQIPLGYKLFYFILDSN